MEGAQHIQCPEVQGQAWGHRPCWGQGTKLRLSWTLAQLNSLQTGISLKLGQKQPAKYLVNIPSERALPEVSCCGEVTTSFHPFSRPMGNLMSASRFLQTRVFPKREHWSFSFRSRYWQFKDSMKKTSHKYNQNSSVNNGNKKAAQTPSNTFVPPPFTQTKHTEKH